MFKEVKNIQFYEGDHNDWDPDTEFVGQLYKRWENSKKHILSLPKTGLEATPATCPTEMNSNYYPKKRDYSRELWEKHNSIYFYSYLASGVSDWRYSGQSFSTRSAKSCHQGDRSRFLGAFTCRTTASDPAIAAG